MSWNIDCSKSTDFIFSSINAYALKQHQWNGELLFVILSENTFTYVFYFLVNRKPSINNTCESYAGSGIEIQNLTLCIKFQ